MRFASVKFRRLRRLKAPAAKELLKAALPLLFFSAFPAYGQLYPQAPELSEEEMSAGELAFHIVFDCRKEILRKKTSLLQEIGEAAAAFSYEDGALPPPAVRRRMDELTLKALKWQLISYIWPDMADHNVLAEEGCASFIEELNENPRIRFLASAQILESFGEDVAGDAAALIMLGADLEDIIEPPQALDRESPQEREIAPSLKLFLESLDPEKQTPL